MHQCVVTLAASLNVHSGSVQYSAGSITAWEPRAPRYGVPVMGITSQCSASARGAPRRSRPWWMTGYLTYAPASTTCDSSRDATTLSQTTISFTPCAAPERKERGSYEAFFSRFGAGWVHLTVSAVE